MASPADTHDYLLERFSALLDLLIAERQALIGRTPDTLQELVSRKEVLCADIARTQSSLLESLKPQNTLPESMAGLRDLAARCRDENALNGRIANRARRTNQTLLSILTGEPVDDRYDRPGAAHGVTGGTPGHHLGSA